MAVVINEFEVVPERPDEGSATPAASPAPAVRLTAAELERMLRQVRERLDRVRAH